MADIEIIKLNGSADKTGEGNLTSRCFFHLAMIKAHRPFGKV
ncbi:MAG: hypothetical protein ABGW96_00340 [Methylophilaceae bacterium]